MVVNVVMRAVMMMVMMMGCRVTSLTFATHSSLNDMKSRHSLCSGFIVD